MTKIALSLWSMIAVLGSLAMNGKMIDARIDDNWSNEISSLSSSSNYNHNMMRRVVSRDDDNVMTIPAIPHRIIKARRRLETGGGLDEFDDVGNMGVRRILGDSSNELEQVGSLYQGYGTHYVDLWVGTPHPQRQTVIVDTGSSITGFPCSSCKDCGHKYHIDKYFMEDHSDTFAKKECGDCLQGKCYDSQCRIRISYQEGSSWTAYEASDMAYLGGPHDTPLEGKGGTDEKDVRTGENPKNANHYQFRLTFGCQYKITGLFKTQLADGIMGMANNKGSFFKQIANSKTLDHSQFSLCYSRPDTAERDGTEAGAVTLGGKDVRMHYDPMVYANNINPSGFYGVHLRKIYLRGGGGESVVTINRNQGKSFLRQISIDESSLNTGGIIIDSGTTDTYLNSRFNNPFRDLWKGLTGSDWSDDSFKLTEEELHQLPTIVFQFSAAQAVGDEEYDLDDPDSVIGLAGNYLDSDHASDVLVAMPATHYLEYVPDEGVYQPRISFSERGGSVLGANFMTGHDVLFDTEHGRIGFSESHCDYDKLVESANILNSKLYPGSPYRKTTNYTFPKDLEISSRNKNVPVGLVTSLSAFAGIFIGLMIHFRNRRSHQYQVTPESELSDLSDTEGTHVESLKFT